MHLKYLKLKISVLLTTATIFSSCAALKSKNSPPATAIDVVGQVIRDSGPTNTSSEITKSFKSSNGVTVYVLNESVQGVKIKENRFDYPVLLNAAVQKWLNYFQGKGRRYFSKYLERSRYFIPEISKTLTASSMPKDLVYLAMIESGFNNSAKSRAKAVGPWQFIRPTGKRYGLTIDYWLDQRRDTKLSTIAAIQYLKELYQEFNSWELAAAGYNAGEGKVRRAIKKYRTSDFWEISRHRFFKPETRDYVPKIMAAAILAKNPEQFGFEDPFKGNEKPTIDIAAEASDLPEPTPKELGEEKPKLEEVSEDAQEVDALRLAELTGSDEDLEEDEDYIDEEELMASAPVSVSKGPEPTMTPSVYMVANPNEQIIEYEVQGPTDLFSISKAAGVPYSTIKLLNPELLRWVTPPYLKTYRLKLPLSIKNRFLATYNDHSFDRRVVFMQYKAKRGDTIQRIAKRYQVEADPIRELNNLNRNASSVSPGVSLVLPLPTGYKRVIANMYDDKPMSSSGRKYRRSRKRTSRHYNRSSRNISHVKHVKRKFERKVSGGF